MTRQKQDGIIIGVNDNQKDTERQQKEQNNMITTRHTDRWNPRKVWIFKRYASGNYYMNQEIAGCRLYKRDTRTTKKHIDAILAHC